MTQEQREILEAFLTFINSEGYIIRRREEHEPELGPEFRKIWIQQFLIQTEDEE